ncbi:ER membrane protein complex subunit 8/9 [Chlorella vulgaris]
MRDAHVDQAALLKILLHATKHPSSGVNGVLLGTLQAASGGGAASATLRVTDAIPVCHGFITLTPVLETALSQIEQHVKAQQGTKGLRIVGYYQCNERLSDSELGGGRRVADRIEAAYPESVALVLDGAALEAALIAAAQQQQGGSEVAAEQGQRQQAGGEAPVLQLFVKDGARGWIKVAPSGSSGKPGLRCPTQGVAAQLAQLASKGMHRSLADFEQHLDDISADWLNPGLLQGPV